MDQLAHYKKSPELSELLEGALRLLDGVPREAVFPTYEAFRRLLPSGVPIDLDLVEATRFTDSLWHMKADGNFRLGVMPFDVGVWICQAAAAAGDTHIRATYYEYEEYSRYLLQYCPIRPDGARLWLKPSDPSGQPQLVAKGKLVDLRAQLAREEQLIEQAQGGVSKVDPFYVYQDFPGHVLQHCPLRPEDARLWEKTDAPDKPLRLLGTGRLSELRLRLAELQGGILNENGKINGSDPARPWTLSEQEDHRHPGLEWLSTRTSESGHDFGR